MLPDSFVYFDRLPERSIGELESFREAGGMVVGIYCIYAPVELIRAAGAIPVGLCGKQEAPIQHAEKELPSNLCPLIKSSYGYAVSDSCPFFSLADLVVGETTCDGKKKMYEFLARCKPLYLMHLPYAQNLSGAEAFWRNEVQRFSNFLATKTGIVATEERISHQIRLHNKMRQEMQRVVSLATEPRSPLAALHLMTILESKSFVVDLEAYIRHLSTLRLELEEIIANSSPADNGSPSRILLTGCPIGKGCEKVLRLVEEAGASVVCMENCTGMKSVLRMIPEDGDPIKAVADRYLGIPCSCMTPNTGRFETIQRLANDFKIDGIIDMTWQFCHTYHIESHVIQRKVRDTLGVPFLHLVTDYSTSDTEQLRTRIEAFLEVAAN